MQDFNGFIEQDYPYQCPECNTELEMKDCLGAGEYPKGGYRGNMKPNWNMALGFECPKCFTKSCCHARECDVDVYNDYKEIMALETE